jgi:sodium/glucose cotransporter 1/sodium/glucose cotransporter 9
LLEFLAFSAVGGYDKLVDDYFYATATNVSEQYESCAYPPSYSMNLFRPVGPGQSDLPWTGMLTGLTISALWYWCTDQVRILVHR